MFPIFPEPEVRVGLNPNITLETEWNMVAIAQQHGLVSVRSYATGDRMNFGLVVDKPKHLINPRPEIISDVFKQVEKMGYLPISVDIRVGTRRRVYEPGKDQPILDQRQK